MQTEFVAPVLASELPLSSTKDSLRLKELLTLSPGLRQDLFQLIEGLASANPAQEAQRLFRDSANSTDLIEAALILGGVPALAARSAMLEKYGDPAISALRSHYSLGSALYAGSFDPFTLGHQDLVERASRGFDRVVVAVGVNRKKSALFSVEERTEMIKHEVSALGNNIEVGSYEGLLADYAQGVGCSLIIRGVRAITDFDQEIQLASNNLNLGLKGGCLLDTVFIPARDKFANVSSTAAREIISCNPERSIPWLVSPYIESLLRARIANK